MGGLLSNETKPSYARREQREKRGTGRQLATDQFQREKAGVKRDRGDKSRRLLTG